MVVRGLGRVAVDHDEDCVVCFIVALVVLCCFGACVHDSGVSSAALEYVLDVCHPVSAAASPASDGFWGGVVVEGEGC